jgi:CubicO group peptidase (beta-lactamase class C family)
VTLLQKIAKSLLLLCRLFILWWTTPSQAIANAAPVPKLENPQELETFFDGIFSAYLGDRQIVGASVSVVKDGELLLAKLGECAVAQDCDCEIT